MSILNITAGEELNNKFKKDGEIWIPFNEAMIKGEYASPLFSKEFCLQRSKVHAVTLEEYKSKLSLFLDVLHRLNDYDEIRLWFGDEPFCQKNREVILQTLMQYKYSGIIILYIVDEITCKTLKKILIK